MMSQGITLSREFGYDDGTSSSTSSSSDAFPVSTTGEKATTRFYDAPITASRVSLGSQTALLKTSTESSQGVRQTTLVSTTNSNMSRMRWQHLSPPNGLSTGSRIGQALSATNPLTRGRPQSSSSRRNKGIELGSPSTFTSDTAASSGPSSYFSAHKTTERNDSKNLSSDNACAPSFPHTTITQGQQPTSGKGTEARKTQFLEDRGFDGDLYNMGSFMPRSNSFPDLASCNSPNKELEMLPPVEANSRGFKFTDFRDDQGNPILGNGCFGTVKKIVHKKTGEVYALKVVSKHLLERYNLIKQMRREIQIHATVDHPHIVKYIFHMEDESNFYLCTEYATGGTVFGRIREAGTFKAEVASRYILQVLSALDCLHSHGIIHRDLKPENLLLFNAPGTLRIEQSTGKAVDNAEEFVIKLCDFGWSNEVKQSQSPERMTFCGTLEYLAPEMVQGLAHDKTLDMWAVGVLLYEFLCGHAPFQGNAANEVFDKILQGRVRFPAAIDADGVSLIMKLLRRNPQERLSTKEVLQHSFIKKFMALGDVVQQPASLLLQNDVPDAEDERSQVIPREKARVNKAERELEIWHRQLMESLSGCTEVLQRILCISGDNVPFNTDSLLQTIPTYISQVEQQMDDLRREQGRLKQEKELVVQALRDSATLRVEDRREMEHLRERIATLEQKQTNDNENVQSLEKKYRDENESLRDKLHNRVFAALSDLAPRESPLTDSIEVYSKEYGADRALLEAAAASLNISLESLLSLKDQSNSSLRRENGRLHKSLKRAEMQLMSEREKLAALQMLNGVVGYKAARRHGFGLKPREVFSLLPQDEYQSYKGNLYEDMEETSSGDETESLSSIIQRPVYFSASVPNGYIPEQPKDNFDAL